jgi:rod shape-determining protein MreC
MAAELLRLRNQLREMKTIEQENIQLRNQLGYLQRVDRRLLPCEVIGRDVSGWWQTVRLGKGVADGVEPDRAVVTANGLVGRTIDVSVRTADVLLISDPTCKVSARITRTGAFGVVRGNGVAWDGRASCRMDFINKNLSVRPGDEVVTSGLGGVFPKGLLIGYVETVQRDSSGLYQQAQILPKASLGMLTYVFVVSEEDAAAELLREKQAGGYAP